MSENGNEEIDVAQLMERIREAAEKRKSEPLIDASATLYHLLNTNGKQGTSNIRALSHVDYQPIPSLSMEPEFAQRERYQLKELLAFQDQTFVRNAYRAVLQREPDEDGYAQYLASLRSGRLDKAELLAKLRYSPEGKLKRVPVDGLSELALFPKIYHLPVIGYLAELVVGIFKLPALRAEQRKLEAHSASRQNLLAEHVNQSLEEIVNRQIEDSEKQSQQLTEELHAVSETHRKIAELHQQQMKAVITKLNALNEDQNILKKDISAHISTTQEMFRQETISQSLQDDELQRLREMLETKVIRRVQQTRMSLVQQERRLLLLMEETRRRQPARPDQAPVEAFDTEREHLLDSLYSSLEDDFRGTRVEIKESLSFYLPILQEAGIDSEILDVGCGRGEWLELLKNEGFSARGVDHNRIMIEHVRQAGLEATETDAISYLRAQADMSLGCITAFHFVEHLPLATLVTFLDECARTLKKNGFVLFETPNPENLLVGSCNFYLDPTHRNPIPATTLKFLLEARGFSRVEILPLHPPTPAVLRGDDELTKQLNQKLFGPMDYAILARMT